MVMMLGICPLWVYAQSRLDSIQHLDEITVVAKSSGKSYLLKNCQAKNFKN